MERTDEIVLSSVLDGGYREALEELLFFNAQQARATAAIERSVEQFGCPSVIVIDERLRLATDRWPEVQSLYALLGDGELIGAILYVRDGNDSMAILHVAVREDYSCAGANAASMLVMRLMTEVRRVAARVKGVRVVRCFDRHGGVAMLPVSGAK